MADKARYLLRFAMSLTAQLQLQRRYSVAEN